MLQTNCKPEQFINRPLVYKQVGQLENQLGGFVNHIGVVQIIRWMFWFASRVNNLQASQKSYKSAVQADWIL